MIVRRHVHYTISPRDMVLRETQDFDPPLEVESPVTVKGPWFALARGQSNPSLRYPTIGGEPSRKLHAPPILRGTSIHIDDSASIISLAPPAGVVLSDIDPGSVHKAEVDLTLLAQRNADGSVTHQLCFLFINPSPHQPVPFNIDACLTKDKHDYVKCLKETPERSYHKLLLRHCLVAGYQVWPDVLKLIEAAAYARVAKSTMATWVKDGWIKASPGTKPRILRRNLEAYLESR